jgi:hypothetical protein
MLNKVIVEDNIECVFPTVEISLRIIFLTLMVNRLYRYRLKDTNVDTKFSFNPSTFFVAVLAMICK